MSREPVVVAENLGKKYWLYPTITRRVLGCFLGPERVGASPLTVLTGLSFELYPGEAIALIGKNGAGKSTALQILAGIIPPSEGKYITHGRVCALLELGAGFNPEFTGRQNIHIAGLLAGLSHEEICASEASIIDFAEIGEYIDQPVKFYSSGMYLRLAFAVALAGTPDILIVDEALAVGDIFFRQKCYDRLRKLREQGMAVLLVTHNAGDVTEFCDRALLLHKGVTEFYGSTTEAMSRYYASGEEHTTILKRCKNDYKYLSDSLDSYSWPDIKKYMQTVPVEYQNQFVPWAKLCSFCLLNENQLPSNIFLQGTKIYIYSVWFVEEAIEIPNVSHTICNDHGIVIYSKGNILTEDFIGIDQCRPPFYIHSCHEIILNIACGEYSLQHTLGESSKYLLSNRHVADYAEWQAGSRWLVDVQNSVSFLVNLPHERKPVKVTHFGLVDLPAKIQIQCLNCESRETL